MEILVECGGNLVGKGAVWVWKMLLVDCKKKKTCTTKYNGL